MTQEQKSILFKDLCGRLPHGVKISVNDKVETLQGINILDNVVEYDSCLSSDIEEVKPYLFPISSMTDEMLEELNANGFFKYRDTIANVSHLESKNGINEEIYTYIDIECISFLIEYFHSHHIDYKGFIEKNLAIDATGLNIY
jgi:hypothetical protein